MDKIDIDLRRLQVRPAWRLFSVHVRHGQVEEHAGAEEAGMAFKTALALAVCFSGVSAEGHAGGNLGLIVQDRIVRDGAQHPVHKYTAIVQDRSGNRSRRIVRDTYTALAPWQYTSQKPWDVPWSNPAIELIKRIRRERQSTDPG